MALRQGKPITFRPTTLCDCVDGSNAPPGAMQQLIDLIPDPSTDKMWVPRPAALQNTGFVAGVSLNGFISALLVVGDTAYGMIAATGGFAGKDIPFAYNLATSTVMTVQGPLSANLPTSPATSGPWTPPIMFQVGSRIIVTHPGFPGGATKFGWMDISGLSVNVTGNTTNTSAVITGNPAILGLQPGLLLTGTGIPAATSIVSAANFVLTEAAATHSNTTLDGLASTTGLAVGQVIAANPVLGIPAGTTIAALPGGGAVTMSQAATATATGTVTFTGATITMSRNATSTNSQETITATGGNPSLPLWGAGDTNINNLPSVPVGGAQFNGRAYFALGTNGIVFSDSLLPCQVSNNPAVQALTTNDGLAVTAIGPLMEYSSTTGGIVQALIAFQDAKKMQQITGDPTTSNLAINALPVATGTSAPLSITPTEYGLAFLSPQGLRIINFQGAVSAPIGDHGSGVTVPFIYSATPSRMVAAANSDTLRMSVNNGNLEIGRAHV